MEGKKERREGQETEGRGGEGIAEYPTTNELLHFTIEDLNFADLFLGKTYF